MFPSSWPGYDLTIGSSGQKVQQIQEQLNRISDNYPAIPKIAADGIYGNQTVTDGQKVRLRLLEQMRVGDIIIPANSVVTGSARITGERLGIGITSIEYAGSIYNVKLNVYDTDGQEGIFIPGSMELNAAKEVAANMGTSMGSSINISSDAGAQLASDLGKGLIQGTSQYIAKKMRTVKVHLKSNYRVMLYADKQ